MKPNRPRPARRFTAPAPLLLFCLLCLAATGFAFRPEAREHVDARVRAPRVLVISLDGLDTRYLLRRDEYNLKIPALRRLMAAGVTARGVVAVYPSVTYPNHTTMVTGALPARHRIFANEVFDPASPQSKNGLWFARDIKADTLWDAAARARLSTGMVSWPVACCAGDWNVPEFWKPGGTQAESFAEIAKHARPAGLVQEVAARDRELYSHVTPDEEDDMRTRFAEYIIAEKRPRVMFVHLFDLDHFQHNFGPFTAEAFAALEKADGYVERLLAAAARAGTLDETTVFIMSDHGFRRYDKQIHPGAILARAGLIEVREERDAKGRMKAIVTDWRAFPVVTGGSCSVMLRDPKDADALRRALAALKNYTGEGNQNFLERGQGILRVIDAREVARLGGNTDAAFMLDAGEGYAFGTNLSGDAVTQNRPRGQHGYLPAPDDYRASFIASGAGVSRRGLIGEVRMIDIGPTVARTLGLTLKDADGRTLKLR
ncbi:MAG TPA: ectonucleotide pyrophosphatase/phosphodiesterase [Pyrinomonadaceae bacterium]|nr:ectonucleotide pyrophosphatase/phosphodiesterase [Pyrinomonadaceae bacterium]